MNKRKLFQDMDLEEQDDLYDDPEDDYYEEDEE